MAGSILRISSAFFYYKCSYLVAILKKTWYFELCLILEQFIRSIIIQFFIIIVIIIIVIIISFMQSIYTYIPETNYVPREYSVAAILLLQFTVLISLVPVLILL